MDAEVEAEEKSPSNEAEEVKVGQSPIGSPSQIQLAPHPPLATKYGTLGVEESK